MAINELHITRVLYNITKTTIKLTFIFFLIASVLSVLTIDDAKPTFDQFRVDESITATVDPFTLKNPQEIEVLFFIISDNSHVEQILLTLQEIDGSGVVIKTIFSISSTEDGIFKQIQLESGSYQFQVSYSRPPEFQSNNDIEVVIVRASVDFVLLSIAIIFIVLFGFAFSIFWISFLLLLLFLIINAITGRSSSSRVVYINTSRSGKQTQNVTRTKLTSPSSKVSYQCSCENSFASKLTTNNWLVLGIAFIMLIGFIFNPDSPLLFFGIILTIVTFYSVSEREKTKSRLMVLLDHNKETHVNSLATQLGKKPKYIIEVLQIMILDDGQPLVLDMNTMIVKVVGSLVRHKPHHSDTEVSFPDKSVEPTVSVKVKQELVTPITKSKPTIHCISCGQALTGKAKYCYECGVKQ